jgi:exonuclease III
MIVEYPVQTRRHNSDKTFPWQLDYVYASPRLEKCVTAAKVECTEEIHGLSDHNPLVLTLEMPQQ